MRWKKILFITALLFVVLITVLYVIISTYDFNKFKPRIIQAVREATGRELTIGGNLNVELGLSAGISIENVSFQNADWGSRAEMAGVKRLKIQVALLPLIRGKIIFERLILVEPIFLLEFSQTGESNLDFGDSAESDGTLPALIFHEVSIEKGAFTYRDDKLSKTHRLIVDRLSFGSRESKKPHGLAFKGSFNGTPFDISGNLDQLALAPGTGADLPVKLAVVFGESEVSIEGEIEDLIQGEGISFGLQAQGKTIRDIGELAGLRGVPDLGPFNFKTTITGSFHRLAAEDIDLSIGAARPFLVSINGNIADLLTQQGIKLNFTARGEDIADLERLIGEPLPIQGAFNVSGKVHDPGPNIYTISDLKTRLDINEISGLIELDLTDQRPKISTTLSSQKLDLRPIISGLDKKSRNSGRSGQSAKKKGQNLPDEPLTKDLLTVADVDLKLNLQNILLPQVKLAKLSAYLSLKDGRIALAGEGPSLPDISELTGVKGVPDLGPFKMTFDVTDPLGKLSIENLVFNAGTPALADLNLTGAIREVLTQRGIKLSFSVRAPDVANLEKYSGQPLPIRGAFGISGQITDAAAKIFMLRNFRAVLGDNKIDGTAEFNLAGKQSRIAVMLSSQNFNLRPLSLPNVDQLVDLKNAADLGPFKLQAVIVDPAGNLSIEKLDFQAGTPKLVEIKIDGFTKELLALRGIELNFSIRGQNVTNFKKLAGPSLPIRGEFGISGQIIDSAAKIYNLTNLRVVLGDYKIHGLADFNLTGHRPQLSARLSSEIIDLEPFFSAAGESSTRAKQPTGQDTLKRNKLLNIPIKSEVLNRANADLKIRIEQLRLPRLAFDNFTMYMVLQDGHMTLTVDSGSMPGLAELTGVAGLTQLGTTRLIIKASSLGDKLAVEELDFDAHIEDLVSVTLDAVVEDFLTQQGITIDFKAQGPDFAKLEKLVGQQLPYKGAFTISGRLDDPTSNVYKLSTLRFIAGDNDLSGWVDLNLTGDRPKIKAALKSFNLDMRWLFTATDHQVNANQVSATADKKRQKIIPNEPLSLGALKIANLDIKFSAKQINLRRTFIRELLINIILEDGHLTAKPLRFYVGDGLVDGYLETYSKGHGAKIAAGLNMDQVAIVSDFRKKEIGEDFEGIFDSKIMITTEGDSIADLMAGLNGSATLVVQGGYINNQYLSLIGGNLANELLNRVNIFNKKQKYVDINCTAIHFDLNAGLAENVFLLDTKDTKLVGAGKINFNNETLNFVFKTSPKKGVKIPLLGRVGFSLGKLTQPFKISGTLADPALVIDPSGTAVTLGKLTGGVMLGPAGLAIVLSDRVKDADPCQQAIDAMKAAKKTGEELKLFEDKSSVEQTTKKLIRGTGKTVQDTPGSIKKFFSH